MSWIALSGNDIDWTCPDRFGPDLVSRNQFLIRGSLVIETRLSPHGRPQTLLGYERRHPWTGRISLQAVPGGGVVVVLNQGGSHFHTVIPPESGARTETLRLTFSWDAPARWGRLSVERPESAGFRMIETPPPPPLMLEDIYTMIHRPQLCERDADVLFFAVSDAIEPVGPQPALASNAVIETQHGTKRACDIRKGELVRTLGGSLQPVLKVVQRTVPALGSFQPVRLRAPYLGLVRDVTVAPHQRLVIGGSEVEYIFGHEAVLIPADALSNGFTGLRDTRRSFVQYFQFVLPRHDALLIAGAAFESLYLGRLRRKRALVPATLLADMDRASFPEHVRAGYQVLRPFEAVTLAEARAA
ncbi:Hint domain-containing protein [Roseivivax lentus]|uniref:Hint domain-containing protein n=1 Tax=Roseivivax lentus TaxID=633194 RepID=A0A1N7MHJ5_9RHOB|nr:Hint domain-containing protein [Roseivivax lentus]SIS85389.1 Hint domain-containing protein [Roseivivax lentus]